MTITQSDEIKLIRDKIRDIPDFPRKGILFKDITPLLMDPDILILTSELLHDPYIATEVDLVAGIESRGFFFGTRLASDLNAGFVPVRKPNKLPSDKITVEYELEYGFDRLEIHSDAIQKESRVVIHDDLMATGGSARAATELVKQLGGIVVGYSFILELTFLNGKTLLEPGVPVYSIVKV